MANNDLKPLYGTARPLTPIRAFTLSELVLARFRDRVSEWGDPTFELLSQALNEMEELRNAWLRHQ